MTDHPRSLAWLKKIKIKKGGESKSLELKDKIKYSQGTPEKITKKPVNSVKTQPQGFIPQILNV